MAKSTSADSRGNTARFGHVIAFHRPLFSTAYYAMTAQDKLTLIKTIHTAIWIFFNVVIFYMLYAALANKIDRWLWIGYGLIVLEAIVLLAFKWYCPLTVWARRYSDSTEANFDIYLPNWLAKYNKLIYTGIMVVIIVLTVVRLMN
jgi:hypothetical protein